MKNAVDVIGKNKIKNISRKKRTKELRKLGVEIGAMPATDGEIEICYVPKSEKETREDLKNKSANTVEITKNIQKIVENVSNDHNKSVLGKRGVEEDGNSIYITELNGFLGLCIRNYSRNFTTSYTVEHKKSSR